MFILMNMSFHVLVLVMQLAFVAVSNWFMWKLCFPVKSFGDNQFVEQLLGEGRIRRMAFYSGGCLLLERAFFHTILQGW